MLCKNSLVSLKRFLAISRHRKVCYPLLCHSRNETSDLKYGLRRESKKRFGKKLPKFGSNLVYQFIILEPNFGAKNKTLDLNSLSAAQK